MSVIASQITGISIIYSTVCSGVNRRKLHVPGLCEGNPPLTNGFPHNGPVTRKMCPFDGFIIIICNTNKYLIPGVENQIRNLNWKKFMEVIAKYDTKMHRGNESGQVILISYLTNIDGLVQDCSNSIAKYLKLLQSCAKPWIYIEKKMYCTANNYCFLNLWMIFSANPWFVELVSQSFHYQGKHALTKDNVVCQRWDSQTPHDHSLTDASQYPDATVQDADNYCRGIGSEPWPWCYTMSSVSWEFCGKLELLCNSSKYISKLKFDFIRLSIFSYAAIMDQKTNLSN